MLFQILNTEIREEGQQVNWAWFVLGEGDKSVHTRIYEKEIEANRQFGGVDCFTGELLLSTEEQSSVFGVLENGNHSFLNLYEMVDYFEQLWFWNGGPMIRFTGYRMAPIWTHRLLARDRFESTMQHIDCFG